MVNIGFRQPRSRAGYGKSIPPRSPAKRHSIMAIQDYGDTCVLLIVLDLNDTYARSV